MTRLLLIPALLAASIGCEPVPCGPTSGVVDGVDVNASLIENGYACVLHIPPNGEVNINEFRQLED